MRCFWLGLIGCNWNLYCTVDDSLRTHLKIMSSELRSFNHFFIGKSTKRDLGRKVGVAGVNARGRFTAQRTVSLIDRSLGSVSRRKPIYLQFPNSQRQLIQYPSFYLVSSLSCTWHVFLMLLILNIAHSPVNNHISVHVNKHRCFFHVIVAGFALSLLITFKNKVMLSSAFVCLSPGFSFIPITLWNRAFSNIFH